MLRFPLYVWIVAAMLVGAGVGVPLNLAGEQGALPRDTVLAIARGGEWFGKIFLALLNMVVVPLVFASLVSSFTSLGQQQGGHLGRLGARTVAYYLLTTCFAVATGLIVVNLVQPGQGLSLDALLGAASAEAQAVGLAVPTVQPDAATSASGVLLDLIARMVPTNVVAAASDNRAILSVIVFAVLFAIAAVRTGGEALQLVDRGARALFDVMMTLTNGVLKTAPLGIGGYVLFVTASTGLQLASALAWYLFAVALALSIHAFVTLPLVLWLGAGRSPLAYAGQLREALLTAFSTASSAGTLPLTLRCATERAGVPERVASFTLPLGATVNMDGTALYEVVAVMFVAQMVGDLTLAQQGVVAVTALLASVGAAGIPHAGTVMMVIVLQAVGLPTDAVLVILAVDRVLDMARTAVNVWSDAIGAAVVARFEPGLAAPSAPAG